jgi:hypothetical protein
MNLVCDLPDVIEIPLKDVVVTRKPTAFLGITLGLVLVAGGFSFSMMSRSIWPWDIKEVTETWYAKIEELQSDG